MAKSVIHIVQDFDVPAKMVFDFFSDHNRLHEIWDGQFRRVKDSSDPGNVNGEGSVREVKVPFLVFEETVTKVVPGRLIEYTISKGSPIKNHLGVMKFIKKDQGKSVMDYTIEFESRIPLLKPILQFALGKGVRKLARRFAKESGKD